MQVLFTAATAWKKRVVSLRVAKDEFEKIEEMANRYAQGNVSDWVRYAAIHFKPRKSDLIDTPDAPPQPKR